jgi:hypothetical protein
MHNAQEVISAQERRERALFAVFGPETRPGYRLSPSQQTLNPAPAPDPGPAPYIAPFDDVYGAIINDPEMAEMFRDHWDDTLPKVNVGPMPGDPAGQLRWFGMRDVAKHYYRRHRHDFEDAKKHRVRKRVEELFAKLSGTDPLFNLTRDLMVFYEQGLPPTAQRALGRMFERCPQEALEFYKEIRRSAERVVCKCHGQRRRG